MRARAENWRHDLLGARVGFGFQIVAMRGQADTYFSLITAPFFAIIFMSIMEYTGRADMKANAVIAPMLMTLWTAALSFAGEMISEDRANGRLESLVAAPASFAALVFGRLCACMLLALPAFLSSVLAAGVVFGYWISIERPVLFVVAAVLTALATASAATALCAIFVLAPGARIVQNTLSFPVYLLGGVLVPVSVFPDWLEVISRALYLSWAADLLRAACSGEAVGGGMAMGICFLAGLGVAMALAGKCSINRFVDRARVVGALSRA